MARKARKSAWRSPLFKFGAIFERSGNASYTFTYQGKRFRKMLPLKFVAANRTAAIQMMESDIRTVIEGKPKNPGANKMLSDIIKEYKSAILKDAPTSVVTMHRQTFTYYLNLDFPITSFDHIQQHILQREAEAPLQPSTRRKRHQYLKRFFKYCVNRGFLPRNPADILEKPTVEASEKEIYTMEEFSAILHNLQTSGRTEAALCVELLFITGMRISEALSLHWSDIGDEKITILGKGKKKRIFPIHLQERLPVLLKELKRFRAGEPKLFQWNNRTNIEKHFLRALEETEIDRRGRCLHTIRKTTGWYMENELNYTQEVICDLLGHSLAVRERHYRRKLQTDELLKKAKTQRS